MNKQIKNIELSSGTLQLNIESEKLSLESVSCFASRRNNRRGFLFVSKVLGKHYPVAPQAMRQIYRQLVREITPCLTDSSGGITCLAMAETATGFGAGIYEELCQITTRPTLFGQSTRYKDSRVDVLFSFQEPHSHAVGHYINKPDYASIGHLTTSTTLILLDDEQSTGTTAENAVKKLLSLMTSVQRVVVVSILNWIGEERKKEFTNNFDGKIVDFRALISGTMKFTPNDDFYFDQLPKSSGKNEDKDLFLAEHSGRRWYKTSPEISPGTLHTVQNILKTTRNSGRPLLVLGTGEFTFLPFLLAEHLEKSGEKVFFQSTTRSPILVEEEKSCINTVIALEDNYDEGVNNFVYNLVPEKYRAIFICYETEHNKNSHQLPKSLENAYQIVS